MLVSLCIPFLGKPVKGFAMNGSKFEPNGRYGAASAHLLCTAPRPRPSQHCPLAGLEGVPDLPVAPQDEAGLTKTFQTWPRGWFHIP